MNFKMRNEPVTDRSKNQRGSGDWRWDQVCADYRKGLLEWLTPALRVIRAENLEFSEVPFRRNWAKACEWLEKTAKQNQPHSDMRLLKQLQQDLVKINGQLGTQWSLEPGHIHLRFEDVDGERRAIPVHNGCPLGRATKELLALSEFSGVRESHLWRLMLTGDRPEKISPIIVTRKTREHHVPGVGAQTRHLVELQLLSPKIPAHRFRHLPERIRTTWGRDQTDAGSEIAGVVDALGGHPEKFRHGERTGFWVGIREELKKRGVRNSHGGWFGWEGAEHAYYRVRPEDKPPRRQRLKK
jgi:hypothetical protein